MESPKHLLIYTYGSQRPARPPRTPIVRIDCRSLSNPMGKLDGSDKQALRTYVQTSPGFPTLLGHAVEKVMQELQHQDEIDCGIYCLYGRHRSPTVAAILADVLAPLGVVASTINL